MAAIRAAAGPSCQSEGVTRALSPIAALGLAAALAACGGTRAPDLFYLTRTGTVAGANLRLQVIDDGLVRCNGGRRRRLPDPLLLQARQIERELERAAHEDRNLPPGRRSILRYRLRMEAGTVTFSDSSRRQTKEMFLTQQFARKVAQQVCGLRR